MDCWEWDGPLDADGYARIGNKQAHRFLYKKLVGPIPKGFVLHHLCENRSCVKPSHLQPLSREEHARIHNLARPAITHCKHGHEFTSENTYVHRAKRYCIACRRQRQRKPLSVRMAI